ncbi:uncharacterized protein LOC117221241 [Megalopta genalis]|uniref:uncharacterized protein LOC117221241 n=1 Tax=Megalopta genalis TaxID=115081 RepID=UPI003FD5D9CC
MKIVIVVAVVVAAAVNTKFVEADMVDVFLNIGREPLLACAKENGFTEETPREIYDKEVQRSLEEATCLSACAMKGLGVLKDSTLNPKMVNVFIKIAYLKDPEMTSVKIKEAAECNEKAKSISDECKMTFYFIKCFMGP